MMWDDGDGWRMHDGSGWGMHDGSGWGLSVLMTVLMLVVVGLLVTLLVASLRTASTARRGARTAGPDALESRRILDRRFASGEIDEQEWRSRRSALDDVGSTD
jgi:putative membrane protein